ncbi:MAG: GAF domain-containing protein [Pirellulales bacterium]
MSEKNAVPILDLSNCEREPIHIPGFVQPHGILLAVNPADMRVVQWSRNSSELLRLAADPDGQAISDLVDGATYRRLVGVTQKGLSGVVTPLETLFRNREEVGVHLGTAHLHDDMLIVEFETHRTEQILLHRVIEDSSESLMRCVREATARLQASADSEELYNVLAAEMRRLTGFDRVMVYRFMQDQHGVVVGEALRSDLEPFLGLHYPAGDIPPQARRLYLLNPLRSIADINAAPEPILPTDNPISGRPLDLTFSAFRSVSPIHIEYLRNMGVAASMSVSILCEGELWGLIACHHYRPRYIPFELRAACELLGTTAGGYVSTRQIAEDIAARTHRQRELADAMHIIHRAQSVKQGLREASDILLRAVDAHGWAFYRRGETTRSGSAPDDKGVRKLIDTIANSTLDVIWSTDSIAESVPDWDAEANNAAGVLIMRLGAANDQLLFFFRPEYVSEVTWGGNPEKTVEPSEDGMRLSPRKSFAQWKQTVRGKSRPWLRVDNHLAHDTHAGLVLLIAQRAADLIRMNEELVRINQDLDSFAYAVSHDLKEPLRTISQTIFFLRRAMSAGDSSECARRINIVQQTTQRMGDLLEGILRVSRAGRSDLKLEWTPLADVVQDAAEIVFPYSESKELELVIHPLPTVLVDFMCLRDVFQNLFSNAKKYSVAPTVRIEVGTVAAETLNSGPPLAPSVPVFYVRDNGIGIATERFADVFQVFRRLHQEQDFGGGSGVGLAIVKRIVERHGGLIWVESQPDAGSTFYFTLEAGYRDE